MCVRVKDLITACVGGDGLLIMDVCVGGNGLLITAVCVGGDGLLMMAVCVGGDGLFYYRRCTYCLCLIYLYMVCVGCCGWVGQDDALHCGQDGWYVG